VKAAIALAALALAGCATTPETLVQERVVEVKVPVATACATARPVPTEPLKQRFTAEEWAALTELQKAALVAQQGLARQTEAEGVRAATAACPELDDEDR